MTSPSNTLPKIAKGETPDEIARKTPNFLKSDLVKLIADHIYLPESEVKRFVDIIFHMILIKVREGYRVKLANFGSFHAYTKRPMKGRNPYLGIEVPIPERTILRFSPSNYTKGFLNEDLRERLKEIDPTKTFTKMKVNDELTRQILENPFESMGYTSV